MELLAIFTLEEVHLKKQKKQVLMKDRRNIKNKKKLYRL